MSKLASAPILIMNQRILIVTVLIVNLIAGTGCYDSQSAWTAYTLTYTAFLGADSFATTIRNTDILIKQNNQWQIVVANYSQPILRKDIIEAFASGKFPLPAPIGNAVKTNAEALVNHFREDFKNFSKANCAADAVIIGPEPNDQIVGAEAARQFFAKWRGEASEWGERPDGIRAGLAADGRVGWVISNLEWLAKSNGGTTAAPLRAVLVYQKGDHAWEIVQAHISVGVPDPA